MRSLKLVFLLLLLESFHADGQMLDPLALEWVNCSVGANVSWLHSQYVNLSHNPSQIGSHLDQIIKVVNLVRDETQRRQNICKDVTSELSWYNFANQSLWEINKVQCYYQKRYVEELTSRLVAAKNGLWCFDREAPSINLTSHQKLQKQFADIFQNLIKLDSKVVHAVEQAKVNETETFIILHEIHNFDLEFEQFRSNLTTILWKKVEEIYSKGLEVAAEDQASLDSYLPLLEWFSKTILVWADLWSNSKND